MRLGMILVAWLRIIAWCHIWLTQIQRLLNEIKSVKQKTLEQNGKKVVDSFQIHEWFDLLEDYIDDIPSRNIYGFDEAGFILGQTQNQTVLTSKPSVPPSATSDSRELVTVIEAISAAGNIIPPYIIFNAKIHSERWYHHTNIPPDWAINISDSGYPNEDIAFDYLQHYITYTNQWAKANEYRLLLLDGHGSYLTYEFLSCCDDNKIIPFAFLPHTSNFQEPLDQ